MCLAGGQFGFNNKNFLKKEIYKYCDFIKSLFDIFKDNFFLEIQRLKNKKNYENLFNY